MPKLQRLTAKEAERFLLQAGFELLRVKGSHHIYKRDDVRIVIPFHAGKMLHPKIVKQVFDAIARTETTH
ncbi:MAG: addiction module toxin, HicA family [Bacteroidetes bacterium]|nr:MAG: addiction module toxin, HicA family [Bacteroidota bacterium]